MPVDREKTLKRLAIILSQIAETADDIARHQAAIAVLNRNGQGANLAQKMLAYVEHMQAINVAEKQRLERLLGRTTPWTTPINEVESQLTATKKNPKPITRLGV